jgi:CRP-like cAMP-binding protein
MSLTLGQVTAAARERLRASDYPGALQSCALALASVPGDDDSRFCLAALLAKVGMDDEARKLYDLLALHSIRGGRPLRAVSALVALGRLSAPTDDLYLQLATSYAAGSPYLARLASAPNSRDPATPVQPAPDQPASFDALVTPTLDRALDTSALGPYSAELSPIPFLSEMAAPELMAVLRTADARALARGDLIMREGEPGDALFLVARGEVAVFRTGDDGQPQEITRLLDNTLLGEMALLTDQPRTASVVAVGDVDLVMLGRSQLAAVAAHSPKVGHALDRFARERLIKNLLATSPLFRPFTRQQQMDLLARFQGVELDQGAAVLTEGQEGPGLFVVLSGHVEVASSASGAPVVLAQLGSGEVFGEMSLLANKPTMATVRALSPCTVLFLHRDYFQRLVGAIAELRTYFEHLAEDRARATGRALLGRRAVPDAPMAAHDADALLL